MDNLNVWIIWLVIHAHFIYPDLLKTVQNLIVGYHHTYSQAKNQPTTMYNHMIMLIKYEF